jgi:uncharacterized protein (UPF0264 family)
MFNDLAQSTRCPGLLISVRSAVEAIEALAGGAEVIDVKEPKRGSLGAADTSTIAEVVRAVHGRAMVTAALGELNELTGRESRVHAALPGGVSLFKIGLADCRKYGRWTSSWRDVIAQLTVKAEPNCPRPVAVVYADWRSAGAPEPSEVLTAAVQARCPALLVDTSEKSSGALFDHWRAADLRLFMEDVRARGIGVVLAGSLVGAAVADAARLRPDLIAVRTAACEGGRNGTVCRGRVLMLKQSIEEAKRHLTSLASTG